MSRAATKLGQSELDRLVTLIEVSRALTAELDLQEIIHRILEGAIRVLPPAEPGLLLLCDPHQHAQTAAVAIVNARLYAAEHESRLRLEALNDEIRSQRDQLERRLQVQDSLAEVVQDDLPLSALATRLARITHASVFLSDALYRVRACDTASPASTLREAEMAAWPVLQPLLRQAAETRAQMRLSPEGNRELLISPVSAGPETL